MLFITFSYSQQGPGGIGTSTNNELWLRADGDVYEDAGTDIAESGDDVYQWNDNSAFGRHIQQINSVDRPEYVANARNNYPSIRFSSSNTEYLGGLNMSDAFYNNYSIFMVGYTSGNTQDFVSILYNGDTEHGILLEALSSNSLRFLHRNPTGTSGGNSLVGGSTRSTTTPQILSCTRGTPGTGIQQFWINSGDNQNTTASDNNFTSSNGDALLFLGFLRPSAPGRYINGDIAEVIMLSEEASLAERLIIENYLAAKYDISLSANDLYTQDNPANGNFDHNVAGIGQASDGSNHTDSQGTGIVRMNTPSALSNGDYLFWGEETISPTYDFSTNTTNYYEQLNSKWRVSKVNDLGTVNIVFDLSGADLSGKQSCQPLQLVVDNDSDFSSPTTYTLNLSGTTASANNITFNDGDYFTVRYLDQIVWDGTAYFNGSGMSNRPTTADACLKLTIKSGGTASINEDAYVRELEVEPSATLNVVDGELLRVENQVLINGLVELLGEAQLIQNHTGTSSNSGSGALTVRQNGSNNLYNYNYWSAPVNRSGNWQIGYLEEAAGVLNFTTAHDANPTTSPITLSSRWLYSYNGTSDTYAQWSQLSTTANIAPGIGYTMKGSGTASEQGYIFRGIPNDGNYTIPIAAGDDILIGNPYPSALNAINFINDNIAPANNSIDGTLYFWEHFADNNSHFLANYRGGYAKYNLMMPVAAEADDSGLTSGEGTASKSAPTQHVAVGQGFFVTASATGGNIQFNNGQRAIARIGSNETVFYKNSNSKKRTSTQQDNRTKIWFTFTKPDSFTKTFGLGFDTNTSYGYDNGYDAKTYSELDNDMNWVLNNEKLVIQALPEIDLDHEIPLRTDIAELDTYIVAISKSLNLPHNINIFLWDRVQNIYYNLSNGEAQLVLDNSTPQDRFAIVLQNSSTLKNPTFETKETFATYDSETKTLKLHQTERLGDIGAFNIYNTLGQKVMTLNNPKTNTINIANLSNGIYVLKILGEHNKNTVDIKFIKH
ncbi:T9SS type A sorting domain-containing protein [Flavobacteriaceae bacterium MHTCC 0001]